MKWIVDLIDALLERLFGRPNPPREDRWDDIKEEHKNERKKSRVD